MDGDRASRLAELDRRLEARGERLSVEALILALHGGARPSAAHERFARQYVASHSLIHDYSPTTSLDALSALGAPLPTIFKAEETPPTKLLQGMTQIEIKGCHHHSILTNTEFVRVFREVAVLCAAEV